MSKVEDLEKEFGIAEETRKRMEGLKQKVHEYMENRRDLFKIIEDQEKQFAAHLEDEKKFLEALPEKIKKRLETEKTLLELRKQILELTK